MPFLNYLSPALRMQRSWWLKVAVSTTYHQASRLARSHATTKNYRVGGGGDEDVDEDNDDEGGGSFAEELEGPHCWLVGSSLRRSMCAR